ncbi:MAG: hypothetical protein EXR74_05925 [Bdellovibrionales bacterium]|nr:hypothetical protein [Bdellovibrionales bacterium]
MTSKNTQKNWMIYGANGFTGKLIAREAKRRKMSVILAGRSSEKLKSLAFELDLPYQAFSLSNMDEIKENLKNISLVLLCAGPFSETSQVMLNACLSLGIHYLDITGEISVLERVLSQDSEAKKQGSVLIPGVGFDVVPSDCLAALLSEKLPAAHELNLAFHGEATLSPGTTKTMLEILPRGGKIRRDGKLTTIPTFSIFKHISFNGKSIHCAAIPWGDVASAFYSTQIPNITVYGSAPKWSRFLKTPIRLMSPILRHTKIQTLIRSQIDKYIHGPTELQQQNARMHLWGEVINSSTRIEGSLEIPEGYHFTMLTALKSVEMVLDGKVKAGSYTPSLAFGANFIKSFENIKLSFKESAFS